MIANHPYLIFVDFKVIHAEFQDLPLAFFTLAGKVYSGQHMINAVAGVVRQHRRKLRNKASIFNKALKIATTIHIESKQRGITKLLCTHEYIGFHKLSRRFKVIIEFR